ncbi:peptidylprolyl isomerase [Paenibacillus sp. MBLB4367]|uniref:peptidylprolyl isomerase n=1 Tax=Paenibacillus sp. MBLB4367 TaxID=3384767 RepID=UPI0039081C3E
MNKLVLVLMCAMLAAVATACGNKPTASPSPSATNKQVQGGGATPSPSTSPSISPSPAGAKQWNKAPEMKIDKNKTYVAEVKTNKGAFKIELFAKDAPKTVNNFVFLAKEGFYDGVIFHRIIESFMIQGGDPKGTGSGGPGYKFEDELKNGHSYEPGIVAMANAGPNTNGSQFFICTGEDSKGLNKQPNYTIFGKISEGMDVVTKIAKTPVAVANGEASSPKEKVTIESVTITEK